MHLVISFPKDWSKPPPHSFYRLSGIKTNMDPPHKAKPQVIYAGSFKRVLIRPTATHLICATKFTDTVFLSLQPWKLSPLDTQGQQSRPLKKKKKRNSSQHQQVSKILENSATIPSYLHSDILGWGISQLSKLQTKSLIHSWIFSGATLI